jgi:hypothetical protein
MMATTYSGATPYFFSARFSVLRYFFQNSRPSLTRRSVSNAVRYSSQVRTRSAGRLIASSTGCARCAFLNTRLSSASPKP